MTTLPFAATTPVSVGRNRPEGEECPRARRILPRRGRAGGDGAPGWRDHARGRRAPVAGPRGGPRGAPGRSALRRAVPHRLPVAGARRPGALGEARHRPPHSGGRGVRSPLSEALYLTDPEGNGIEIYADRPRDAWTWNGDSVAIATLPLDIRGLVASLPEADGGWQGAPPGSVVGHVHLRVGDPEEAEAFWNSEMGFDTVHRLAGSAVFLSSGGYHHHVGANSWQSRGAGRRADDRSGLAWVELLSDDFTGGEAVSDPWSTMIRRAPRLA